MAPARFKASPDGCSTISTTFPQRLRLALANPRLQAALLALAALPPGFLYLHACYVTPFFDSSSDWTVYIRAAGKLTAHQSPYPAAGYPPDLPASFSGTYIYPPLWAWLLQPVAHLSRFGQALVVCVGAQLLIWGFVILVVTALRIQGRRARFGTGLLLLSVFLVMPASNIGFVLLFLTGLWFFACSRDRAWGYLPLGFSIGLKLIAAPYLLLPLVQRKWNSLFLAFAAVGATLLVGLQFIPEYVFKVLPPMATSTADIRNSSFAAILTRSLHPAILVAPADRSFLDVKLLTLAFGLAVVAVTALAIRGSVTDPRVGALDAAAVICLASLLAPVLFASHLSPIVLVLVVLGAHAVRQKRRGTLLATIGLVIIWLTTDRVEVALGSPSEATRLLFEVLASLYFVLAFVSWGLCLYERWKIVALPAPAGSPFNEVPPKPFRVLLAPWIRYSGVARGEIPASTY